MLKSVPRKPVVPEAETLPNLWANLWTMFEHNLPYTTLCLISTVITVVLTVVFLMNRFKREGNADGNETAGDGDKKEVIDKKEDKNNEEEQVSDKQGEEIENVDTSEGQDGSEEDLPWILQKAPSETTLSDEKENLTNDEKQSEGTESEKSQDFVRFGKSAAGDLKGVVKKEAIMNEG